MKRLVKKVVRAAWRATSPIRGPVSRRFHDQLVQAGIAALAQAEAVSVHERVLPPLYWGFEAQIAATHSSARAISAETSLVLNSMVRELARLQIQVEVLQQMVQDNGRAHGGLSIVGEAGEGRDAYSPRDRPVEHMRVG